MLVNIDVPPQIVIADIPDAVLIDKPLAVEAFLTSPAAVSLSWSSVVENGK